MSNFSMYNLKKLIKSTEKVCGPVFNSKDHYQQTSVWPELIGTRCWISKTPLARGIYEFIHGELPSNLKVCHKCDNIFGYCYNPNHLFKGSQKENIKDGIIKKRYVKSQEFKDKISKFQKNRKRSPMTEEFKKNMSKIKTGKKNPKNSIALKAYWAKIKSQQSSQLLTQIQ